MRAGATFRIRWIWIRRGNGWHYTAAQGARRAVALRASPPGGILIQGHFPPVPTPFSGGLVSVEAFRENLERWNEDPIDGYVVLGSNGEAPLLDDHERQCVVRVAWETLRAGRKLIVGAGRESTRGTIRSVKEAFDLGADAALVGVPCYYRPAMTEAVLRDHYLRVADASPGPLLLYSVPAFTGIPIGHALFGDLSRHERVSGIKDSSGDPASIVSLVAAAAAAGRESSILVGNASALAEGLIAGAAGSVLAVTCVAPDRIRQIGAHVAAGRAEEARRLNSEIAPLAGAVTKIHGIGGLKAALELRGFHGGAPRPPLPPADASGRADIAAMMTALGILS